MTQLRYRVFVYGTLLDAGVRRQVTGRALSGCTAVLPGYRRYRLRQRCYPAIVAEPGATVSGLLLNVDPPRLAALDRYEDPCYERHTVTVYADSEAITACAYVITPDRRHLIDPRDWDLAFWRRCRRQR